MFHSATPKRRQASGGREPLTLETSRNELRAELASIDIHLPVSFFWDRPDLRDAQQLWSCATHFILNDDDDEKNKLPTSEVPLGGYAGLDLFRLLRRSQKVQEILDCEVTLEDLVRPDVIRTLRVVDSFLKYVRFKKEINEAPWCQELAVLSSSVAKLELEIDSSKAEIVKLRQQLRERSEEIATNEAENSRLKASIRSYHDQFVVLKAKKREMEAKDADLDQDITTLDSSISQAETQQKDLEARIVRSPRRLQKALEDLHLTKEAEERKLRGSNEERHQMTRRLQVLEGLRLRLEESGGSLSQIDKGLQMEKQERQRLSLLESELEEAKKRCREKEKSRAQAANDLKEVTNLYTSHKALYAKQVEDVVEEKCRLEEKLEERKAQLSAQTREAVTAEQKVKELEVAMHRRRIAQQKELKQCAILEDKLLAYKSKLEKVVGKALEESSRVWGDPMSELKHSDLARQLRSLGVITPEDEEEIAAHAVRCQVEGEKECTEEILKMKTKLETQRSNQRRKKSRKDNSENINNQRG